MDLILRRTSFEDQGVFGELIVPDAGRIAVTLEHSYGKKAKIPDGVYICVRGQHRLHSMKQPFETFEITGIPNHAQILLHAGNYNDDSDGCVLVGTLRIGNMISDSRAAFERFMKLQEDVKTFTLTVES